MEPSTRVELVTPSLPRTCSTPELRGLASATWSGRRGSNPRPTAWKAVTLPTELLPRLKAEGRRQKSEVNPAECLYLRHCLISAFCFLPSDFKKMVASGGFEPS